MEVDEGSDQNHHVSYVQQLQVKSSQPFRRQIIIIIFLTLNMTNSHFNVRIHLLQLNLGEKNNVIDFKSLSDKRVTHTHSGHKKTNSLKIVSVTPLFSSPC